MINWSISINVRERMMLESMASKTRRAVLLIAPDSPTKKGFTVRISRHRKPYLHHKFTKNQQSNEKVMEVPVLHKLALHHQEPLKMLVSPLFRYQINQVVT